MGQTLAYGLQRVWPVDTLVSDWEKYVSVVPSPPCGAPGCVALRKDADGKRGLWVRALSTTYSCAPLGKSLNLASACKERELCGTSTYQFC